MYMAELVDGLKQTQWNYLKAMKALKFSVSEMEHQRKAFATKNIKGKMYDERNERKCIERICRRCEEKL